jgi:hypothetical protein
MAKKKKKATPRRRRTVVKSPTQYDPDAEDIQVRRQKFLAVLYEGLNTKEEILKRWQDEIIKPIYYDATLLTDEHKKLLVWWWKMYKHQILNDDHETAETVILKITTEVFIGTLADLFRPVRYRRSVFKKVCKLIDGFGEAQRSANHSDQVK